MTKQTATINFRIDLPGGHRFGPGKAALLEMIAQHGSVAGAARELGMSYPRALRLLGEMNTQFDVALVQTFQGGASRGGAELTALGRYILDLYTRMRHAITSASQADLQELNHLAKPKPN